MFDNLFNHLQEDRYQQGCRDRLAGRLPSRQDSQYLSGYLSDRPKGLDAEIEYFSTLEEYLKRKR